MKIYTRMFFHYYESVDFAVFLYIYILKIYHDLVNCTCLVSSNYINYLISKSREKF